MINNQLFHDLFSIQFPIEFNFSQLGLSNISLPCSLSFIDDKKYLNEINTNVNISGVLCTPQLSTSIDPSKKILIIHDPRFYYFTLYNFLAKKSKLIFDTKIDASSEVNSRAYIASKNVIIGKHCKINANVSILEDVEIGDYCNIQSGTVIGSEGFEYKKTSKGILAVFHDGKVVIGNNVDIGANTCIDKGFSFRNTIIDDNVKIDNLIHVAHGVHLKNGAFIIAGTIIGGSAVISENSWMSINSSIAPGITVRANGFVSIAAVVTKNVDEDQQVTGNFAIPHQKFMANLKKSLE